jgi:hypothetical protein
MNVIVVVLENKMGYDLYAEVSHAKFRDDLNEILKILGMKNMNMEDYNDEEVIEKIINKLNRYL